MSAFGGKADIPSIDHGLAMVVGEDPKVHFLRLGTVRQRDGLVQHNVGRQYRLDTADRKTTRFRAQRRCWRSLLNVRFWHKADISQLSSNVCFWG